MDTTYSTVVWHYTYHVVHSQRHRRTLSANCHIHDCLGKKIHSSFSAVQTPTPPPHPPACSDAAEATQQTGCGGAHGWPHRVNDGRHADSRHSHGRAAATASDARGRTR
jgi:hypothetical protein